MIYVYMYMYIYIYIYIYIQTPVSISISVSVLLFVPPHYQLAMPVSISMPHPLNPFAPVVDLSKWPLLPKFFIDVFLALH